ncbi:ATP-binding protein [Gloeothece verrucosa]|uniref:Uncharacterized protein n=1 Tax=Gloeothece verrucosa (strain PCC 7822) TaxID=497965 RepID=E0UC54_GLOV7|nr:DUF1611 domain-containing protein [Gloeothece verrucosa]ADN16392.1 conserved hypothetical protein [Gloeothece verrucosa PCC 7822]
MFNKYFFTSLTRISDLAAQPFEVKPIPREQWATGDYVVGEIISPLGKTAIIELVTGRMVEVLEGDQIVGAFGMRRATLEAVGDWQHIDKDGYMEALTEGGLFGKATSISFLLNNLPPMKYQGHVWRQNHKVCMQDFVPYVAPVPYNCPTILMLGTSMSCGKTTTARVIIRLLKQAGLKIVAAKLAGAGQYHDILSMQDAGADKIFDFVDIGLPSSVCLAEEFRSYVRQLLSRIAAEKPDVVIAEVGASPFEPYNGKVVLEEIKNQICCTVLCASDPYAVIGAIHEFGLQPNVISGIVTDTTAGVALVENMTGIPAITIFDRESQHKLKEILKVQLSSKHLTLSS